MSNISAEIETTVCPLPSVPTKYGNSLGISVNENNFSTKLGMLSMHSVGQALKRLRGTLCPTSRTQIDRDGRAAAVRHCIAVMIIM